MEKINFYKDSRFFDYGVINLTPIRRHFTLNIKNNFKFSKSNYKKKYEQVCNDTYKFVLPMDIIKKQNLALKISKYIIGTIVISGITYFILSSAFVESLIFSIPWLYNLLTTSFELNIPTLHGTINYVFINSYYWDVLTDILFLIL